MESTADIVAAIIVQSAILSLTIFLPTPDIVRGDLKAQDANVFPSLKGGPMLTADTPNDRSKGYALRLTSDRFFEGCVFNGYIVGRDLLTYEDMDADLVNTERKTPRKELIKLIIKKTSRLLIWRILILIPLYAVGLPWQASSAGHLCSGS